MSNVTNVFLCGMQSFVATRLISHGYSKRDAEKAGMIIVSQVAAAWSSGLVYITKAHRYRNLLIARDIYHDFNGHNHSELCKKYDKSIPQIYSIVRKMRDEYVSHRQRDMFDDREPDNSKVAECCRLGLETLSQLMALCEQGLNASLTIDKELARTIGEQLADWAAREHGGQFIYIKANHEKDPSDGQTDMFST